MKEVPARSSPVDTPAAELVLPPRNQQVAWTASVLLLLAAGVFLRLRGLSSLIFLGVEYDAVNVASKHTYWECLTYYALIDTSAPMSIWARMLFDLGMVTELSMRLPSVIAGVALLLCPLLLLRRLGRAPTLILIGMLATLPIFNYFSVTARPYAEAVLFLFLAFICWDDWLARGRRQSMAAFVVFSSLAAFFQPLCLVVVATMYLVSALQGVRQTTVSVRSVVAAVIGGTALLALLLGPGALNLLDQVWNNRGPEESRWQYPAQVWNLLTGDLGTTSGLLLVVAVLGVVDMCRRDPRFGAAGVALPLMHWGFLEFIRPQGNVVDWARLAAVVFPIVLVFVATGFVFLLSILRLAMRRNVIFSLCFCWAVLILARPPGEGHWPPWALDDPAPASGFWTALGWALSPLMSLGMLAVIVAALVSRTKQRTNGSSDHSREAVPGGRDRGEVAAMVFTVTFALGLTLLSPIRWSSRGVDDFRTHIISQLPESDEIPDTPLVYEKLAIHALTGDLILECPAPRAMAHPAPFDEYQRIHGKRVVFVALEPFSHQTRSVSFKNTIDLVDRRAIAASGGRFLVLHKDLAGEFEALHLGNLLIDADRRNTIQQVEAADEYLRTNYGEPVFDDEWFSVYDVQSSE